MKASAALRKEADAGDCWNGFRPGDWLSSINVRDFIVRNVTPYTGDEAFLAGPSQRTRTRPTPHCCTTSPGVRGFPPAVSHA